MTESIESYVDHVIDVTQKQNVDLALVIGYEVLNNQIRFSQNKIDINKQWQSNRIDSIIVVNENQLVLGNFSPNNKAYVEERIQAQIDFAQKMSPSPFFKGVATMKHAFPMVKDQFDPNIDDYSEKAPDIINSCINEAISAGAKRVAGSFFFGKNKIYINSSAGPNGTFAKTSYNLTIRAFQEELDASGQGLATGCIPNKAEEELLNAASTAGRFSKLHQNSKQGKPGKYDIIMSPAVAGDLLGRIPKDANPFVIMLGRSSLGDKMGESLGPEFLNINDNGLQPDGLGSAPVDIEGTPRKNTPIFKDGVLVNYIHNTSTAKMLQGETTGNSALVNIGIGTKLLAPANTNVIFNNGDHSFEELLDTPRKTIYVTCNWYTRYTSRVSTEYSTIPRDAAFIVENGELSTPIKNFRISDNMLRQFANIDAMGNDRVQVKWWEVPTPTWIPTLRVKDCRVTTATQ
ncbi:MAG: metallopeptidase TldD-related protein [Candidatus Hodarchaeales archaeon]